MLQTDDLAVALPNGTPLLAGAALAVKPGDSVLLQGPSGSGKSTLFRSFAGIWPFSQGIAAGARQRRLHAPAALRAGRQVCAMR